MAKVIEPVKARGRFSRRVLGVRDRRLEVHDIARDATDGIQRQERVTQVIQHTCEHDDVELLGEHLGELIHTRLNVLGARPEQFLQRTKPEPIGVEYVHRDNWVGPASFGLERHAAVGRTDIQGRLAGQVFWEIERKQEPGDDASLVFQLPGRG